MIKEFPFKIDENSQELPLQTEEKIFYIVNIRTFIRKGSHILLNKDKKRTIRFIYI